MNLLASLPKGRFTGRVGRLLAFLVAGIWPGHLKGQSLPAPSGAHAIGVSRLVLVDSSRNEPLTADPKDRREVVVQLWYPARFRSDFNAPYSLDSALWRESFGPNAARRLSAIGTNAIWNAPAAARAPLPVVLLSPAAGSDPGFYAGIGEEFASRGFVVAALGHPYEKPSLRLSGGRMAIAPPPRSDADAFRATHERILWRAHDLRFVLTRLAKGLDEPVALRVDAKRAVVMGHSRGGVAALESCKLDTRYRACVNIDGGVLGGPYYDDSARVGPRAPMLWLQAYHPAPADSQLTSWKMTRAQWDSFDIRANRLIGRAAGGGWRVVIPDSVHEAFSDTEWALADSAGKTRALQTLLMIRALLSQYVSDMVAGRRPDFDRWVREGRVRRAESFSRER